MTHRELAKLIDEVLAMNTPRNEEALIRLSGAFADAKNDKDGVARGIDAMKKMLGRKR